MLKPPRRKKCKNCKEYFQPFNSFQVCCDTSCAIAYNKVKKKKEHRRAVKAMRGEDKATLRKDCQKLSNRLGKLFNMLKGEERCITCNSFSENQMDGGHCFPTSTYSPIRYYTLQIRPQCVKCNRFNGGMPNEFEEYLTKELGKEKVAWLKSHKGQITKKFTVQYLQKYKRVMGKRLKRQEKLYNI